MLMQRLLRFQDFKPTFSKIIVVDEKQYPVTIQGYMHWLEKYSQMKHFNRNPLYQNHIIYDFEHDKNAMAKSIIDYLSGMSDAYILKIFNEFISFS